MTSNKTPISSSKKHKNNSIKKHKISQTINPERFSRIQKWREKQKRKEMEKKKIIDEKEQIIKLKAERILLRKIQEKEKNLLQKKRKEEAARMRLEYHLEKKRKQMDEEKEIKKSINIIKKKKEDIKESIDPLDAYMNKIYLEEKKINDKNQIKNKRKNGKLKKVKTREILSNETVYDENDLVITEEVSWLDRIKKKKKEIKKIDHITTDYKPFRKNFYIESPEISAMSSIEVETFRNEKLENVKIRGLNCPKPIMKWSQCGLREKLYKVLERNKYDEPFAIQCQAIPCIMSGRDVIACAKTGSGKTLAFIIPMFRHILAQEMCGAGDGPIGLVLSPTRELAIQTFIETKKFAQALKLKVICCYGGATVSDQISDLKKGADIIIATPGRMIDMLCVNGGRVTNTRRVTYLVLDEADRMFDMGFEPQVTAIIDSIRPDRQTLMFSATFPKMIESLAKRILKTPIEIVIGGRSKASNDVIQVIKILDEEEKFNALLKILGENYNKGQILIFMDRQDSVDHLFQCLQDAGYYTLTLHGGMDQNDRDCMIQDFKNKTRTILIATSIAARGLDVKDLNLVINYEVPTHYEDYVHRIGRTGRAGIKGYAYTFITRKQEKFASELYKALKKSNKLSNIPPKLEEMATNYKKKLESGNIEHYTNTVRSSGSKGFKFDEVEAHTTQLKKQRQEAVYGSSADKHMTEQEIKAKREADAAEHARTNVLKNDKNNKSSSKEISFIEKQLEAAKAGVNAMKATLNVTNYTHNEEETKILAGIAFKSAYNETQKSNAQTLNKVKAIAFANSINITKKINSLGASATPHNLEEAINKRMYTRKFEINDYPAKARIKATSKSATEHIEEFLDVSITTQGSYFPPGRHPGLDEEKLHLHISGRSESEVNQAYRDLKQLVEEEAKNTHPGQEYGGKFTVI